MERLDKFLANAGVGTRSEVKKYAKAGRIQVNGVIMKNTDGKIDPDQDEISFDGELLSSEKFEYHMLYKPQGCVTATTDRHDPTVMDYITSTRKEKLFPVGRLDKDTEGLLLITDDGELSHRLLAPKKHVPKTYFATVTGNVTEKEKELFEKGLDIGDEKLTLPASLKICQVKQMDAAAEANGSDEPIKSKEQNTCMTDTLVTISEGRFHQIKRMFLAIGHEVVFLKRLSMGPLTLDASLKPGDSRRLTSEEVTRLTALKQGG